MSDVSVSTSDLFDVVVGQADAVARLRAAAGSPSHAYLFVGPRGSGKLAAAWAFAGEVLAQRADGADEAERFRRLATERKLADVEVVEPQGKDFRLEEAAIVREAAHRSPTEGSHYFVFGDQFHTAANPRPPSALSLLLKTIEEPPPTAVIVLLSETALSEFPTIASRCIKIDFGPVPAAVIESQLLADGIAPREAALAAAAANGNLTRARLLATDPAVAHRRRAWSDAPARLDGTGSAVGALVAELRALIDGASESLGARQQSERDELEALAEAAHVTKGQREAMSDRHKREARLLRNDELRFGLATLAWRYRDGVESTPDPTARFAAINRLARFVETMERNPNEALQLQALFLDLPAL